MSDSPALPLPRGLIFLASVWLIASWVLAIGLRAPVQASSASYTPGVAQMLLHISIGLMIGWPLLRLSQTQRPYPIQQTILDLLVLLGLVQVVLWPLRLVTIWTPQRTAAIDATLAGWTVLVGAIIAGAIMSAKAGPRLIAMITCLAMCVLGPLLAWLGLMTGVDARQLVDLSPLMALRTLGEGGGSQPTVIQWRWILLLAFAAVMAWIALGLWMLVQRVLFATPHDVPQRSVD